MTDWRVDRGFWCKDVRSCDGFASRVVMAWWAGEGRRWPASAIHLAYDLAVEVLSCEGAGAGWRATAVEVDDPLG